MKAYRNLTISGSRDQLLAAAAEIEAMLIDGWARNKVYEENMSQSALLSAELCFCFSCSPTTARRGAFLALMSNRAGNLSLANIVPNERERLSCDEFNYIVEEFLEKFAKPAAARAGATINVSSGVVSIDDWFSKDTGAKLRRFLQRPGRGATSHPEDDKLWKSFLVSAHREHATVHADLLRRWLEEDAGCDQYRALELASDYERSREILSFEEQYQGA